MNLDFAPVSDVVPPGADATNQPIGVLRREYGHDPGTVGRHVAAFIAGMKNAGVATTAKHFPGLGRVVANTDFAAGVVDDVTAAGDPYLALFRAAIAAKVPFVMVALATYTRIDPRNLAAFSPLVINGLLRQDLGFRGVVMSDSLTAAAVVAIPPGQRAIRFLLAGGDFVVARTAGVTMAMIAAVKARAATDSRFSARVDDGCCASCGRSRRPAFCPARPEPLSTSCVPGRLATFSRRGSRGSRTARPGWGGRRRRCRTAGPRGRAGRPRPGTSRPHGARAVARRRTRPARPERRAMGRRPGGRSGSSSSTGSCER